MRQLIAIATADWHIHRFRDHDSGGSRLDWAIKAGNHILNVANQRKVPLLFAGDLFHNPKELENETLDRVTMMFRTGVTDFYCISGNHDMSQKNGLNNRSPSYMYSLFNAFPDKINYPNADGWIANKGMINVYGFDYHNDEDELIKRVKKTIPAQKDKINILLLHGNPPGCIQCNGTEAESDFPKDIDKFFKHWDLVLWGHIHKPQQISKKCFMLGSPIQQNFGDEGIEMGYWKIYSDKTMKFVCMNETFPCFVTGTESALNQGDAAGFIKHYDYTRVIEEEKPGEEVGGDFNVLTHSRKEIARKFCKTKGIKSKRKIKTLIHILNKV